MLDLRIGFVKILVMKDVQPLPKKESARPSLLGDIKTVTLEFAKFKRRPSDSSMGGMLGMGLMGAGFGPLGAIIGMGIGAVAGEVSNVRANRSSQQQSRG